MADKSAINFKGKPKGKKYCNTPGNACWYNEKDICVHCGRKKGWRRA